MYGNTIWAWVDCAWLAQTLPRRQQSSANFFPAGYSDGIIGYGGSFTLPLLVFGLTTPIFSHPLPSILYRCMIRSMIGFSDPSLTSPHHGVAASYIAAFFERRLTYWRSFQDLYYNHALIMIAESRWSSHLAIPSAILVPYLGTDILFKWTMLKQLRAKMLHNSPS